MCDDGSSVVPKCCYFSNDFTTVGKRASSGGKVLTVPSTRKEQGHLKLGGKQCSGVQSSRLCGKEEKKKAEVLILCVAANREVD